MSTLLTARAVAERLDVSAETILRWQRRGELPAIRLPGGAIRFDEDELEQWLEQRTTDAQRVRRSGAIRLASEAPDSEEDT